MNALLSNYSGQKKKEIQKKKRISTWTQQMTSNSIPRIKAADTMVSTDLCGPRFYGINLYNL